MENSSPLWVPGTVEVDFGAGSVTVPRGLKVLSARDPRVPIPTDGHVDWSQLEKLPNLITVKWSGADRGVVAAAAARRVQYLEWFDAAGEVDLSATSVKQVRLGGAGLRHIRLPESIQRLHVSDPPLPGLQVQAPDDGHGMELQLFWRSANGNQVQIPAGLDRTTSLWLWVDRQATMTVLSNLVDLQELKVTFEQPPGTPTDLPDLRLLSDLRTLEFDSAYDWDPDALPRLPALRRLVLNGVRRATAAALKSRLRGSGVKVTARGTKTDAWLAAHMFNPFRDWVDDSRAFGSAACRAYTAARTAVDAAPPADPERGPAVQAALRGLVADLNAINARFELIDTINREHAIAVCLELAQHANVDLELAEQWVDEDRRW